MLSDAKVQDILVTAFNAIDELPSTLNAWKQITQPKQENIRLKLADGQGEFEKYVVESIDWASLRGEQSPKNWKRWMKYAKDETACDSRRIMLAYLISLLAEELTKRAQYTVAMFAVVKEKHELDLAQLAQGLELEVDNAPISAEYFEALEVLANVTAQSKGYASVTDIFAKTASADQKIEITSTAPAKKKYIAPKK